MFDSLKNLFGGIFAFLGKLLGFKKSQYALEFESAASATPAAANKSAKAEPAKAETAKTKASKPAIESKPAAKATQQVDGFATSYLMPTATSTRRRPSANMNSFLNMARQVKTVR